MKKAVFLGLILLSLFFLMMRFGLNPILEKAGFKPKAGLKIVSVPEASVLIDGKEAGMTPYEDGNLPVGEYTVKLVAEGAQWQGKVRLTSGTMTVISRELGESLASSSGEVFFLSKGKGVVVTSTPSGAEIEIDGKSYGQTPLILAALLPGEHTFALNREGYLKRSIKATLPPNLALNLDVVLAVAEVSIGVLPTPPQAEKTVQLIVKQTQPGYLRIRSRPSTGGTELGRVVPGDVLTLIEELGSWDKIKTADGIEGYVSAAYVQIIRE